MLVLFKEFADFSVEITDENVSVPLLLSPFSLLILSAVLEILAWSNCAVRFLVLSFVTYCIFLK